MLCKIIPRLSYYIIKSLKLAISNLTLHKVKLTSIRAYINPHRHSNANSNTKCNTRRMHAEFFRLGKGRSGNGFGALAITPVSDCVWHTSRQDKVPLKENTTKTWDPKSSKSFGYYEKCAKSEVGAWGKRMGGGRCKEECMGMGRRQSSSSRIAIIFSSCSACLEHHKTL